MTRPISLGLRRRVVMAIDAGMTTQAAADRFSIGKSTAGAWHRLWRAMGDVVPGRQGSQGGSILDPHEAFLLRLIEQTKDIALYEMAERLEAEHGLKPPFDDLVLPRPARDQGQKKLRTPPSRSGATSARRVKLGSKDSRISIPTG